MRKFLLDKVVRSKLIARMRADRTEVESQELTGDRAYKAVLRKIAEEAAEALEAPRQKRAAELADIQTAIKDAITLSGVSPAEVDQLEEQLAAEKGRFIPTIHVRTVNVQDDDPIAEYYGSRPDRFPETR
ncbi:MAG TPA: hypothetical protein VGE30_04105 [Candidatus Saccharimonadales bacterium]